MFDFQGDTIFDQDYIGGHHQRDHSYSDINEKNILNIEKDNDISKDVLEDYQ